MNKEIEDPLVTEFWKALEDHYPEPVFTETLFNHFLETVYHSYPRPIAILEHCNRIAKTGELHYDGIPIDLPKETSHE